MSSGHYNPYNTYRSTQSVHSRTACPAIDYITSPSVFSIRHHLENDSVNGTGHYYHTKKSDHHHQQQQKEQQTSNTDLNHIDCVHNYTRTWKTVPMVSSILAFIYVYLHFHNINRKIELLNYISVNWFVTDAPVNDEKFQLKNTFSEYIVIKEDIDHLISQLWLSRTTLIMTLVFIAVYVIAWTFLLIFLLNQKIESWRAIVTMIIFASIDIAASGGFVLIRLVTYGLRSNDDEYKILPKHGPIEKNELISLASLRLSLFQSSSGSIDIMVTLVIASIACLRLYSIYLLLLLYNRKNKLRISGLCTYFDDRSIQGKSDDQLTVKINDEHLGTFRSSTKPAIENISPNGSSFGHDLDENDVIVDAAEMPAPMQKMAKQVILEAANIYKEEKHIAECLKRKFDEAYEPTWHCIVGKNWGSCVTHSKHCYIRLTVKNLTILLYRSS